MATPTEYRIDLKRTFYSDLATWALSFVIFIVVVIIAFISYGIVAKETFFKHLDVLIYPLLGFASIFLIALLIYGYNFWLLSTIRCSLDAQNLTFKGGIISRFEKVLPFKKIQHVIVSRTLTQRFFGLASVDIETAHQGPVVQRNGQYSQISNNNPFLKGLSLKDALSLRDALLAKILKTKGQGI